ncbi:MAG: 30S ribosome-binding factor RbfA, partial [Ignavibacteria bacterium]|nr:30S ribosome-binding factor RbfA [Ignavibacteria bacterium]
MSIRTERVASLIRHEIGAIFGREFNDPSVGFITVTDVRMTADLKIARISLSVLGSEKVRSKTMEMLESEKQHIRGLLGSQLRLKYTPALQFYLDETLERVDRINKLIQKIHEDDGSRDGGAGS